MTQLLSKTHLQAFSSILALVLLLSTIPFNSGVVIVPGSNSPELMIDVCQPTQLFGQALNNILARPSTNVPQFILFLGGPLKTTPLVGVVERNIAPETPPPKPPI
jgi:hypothetical protein